MVIQDLGTRCVLFTFDDQISICLIRGSNRVYLCDTHLGPDSMECVKEYIATHHDGKEIIVFNTHSDWDHVWGNCAFPGAIIIGHQQCRERLREIGPFDLEHMASYHRGAVELILPNLTFSEKMIFEEDDIEFIHMPGHTVDSAVCFDRRDSVLFVGDLVEDPIPYLDYRDLQTYITTLQKIKEIPAAIKISAHSGIIDTPLIVKNMNYITDILTGNPVNPEIYQNAPDVHKFNLNNRLFLHYEDLIREKSATKFNYHTFRDWFGDLKKIGNDELKEALECYMQGISIRNQNGSRSDVKGNRDFSGG